MNSAPKIGVVHMTIERGSKVEALLSDWSARTKISATLLLVY